MKRSLICLVFLTALLGMFSSLWAQTTLEVPSVTYPTIQSAITAAVDGDVINIAAGTYLITSKIIVDKNISIEGQGTVTLMANNASWATDNSGKHLIGIYGGTDTSPVTISNITMNCNSQSHGLQAYDNAFGNLNNVTINNSKGAGLIVNGEVDYFVRTKSQIL